MLRRRHYCFYPKDIEPHLSILLLPIATDQSSDVIFPEQYKKIFFFLKPSAGCYGQQIDVINEAHCAVGGCSESNGTWHHGGRTQCHLCTPLTNTEL